MGQNAFKTIVLWTLLGTLFVSAAVYVTFLSSRDALNVRDRTPIAKDFQH